MSIVVRVVDPVQTLELRHRVLRPRQDLATLAAEVVAPESATFGASLDLSAPILATATVYPEAPPPSCPTISQLATTLRPWRLRGVATDEAYRSQGFGKSVLDAVIDFISHDRGAVLWCYARLGARSFYEREQFTSVGEIITFAEIGPHIVMYRTVEAQVDAATRRANF